MYKLGIKDNLLSYHCRLYYQLSTQNYYFINGFKKKVCSGCVIIKNNRKMLDQ